MARGALRHGAELHGHEPVTAWHEDDHGVSVTTPKRTYQADRVVFAGGAWTDRVVTDLGVPLTVTRQTFGWFAPRSEAPLQLGTLPSWFFDVGDGWGYYGFPALPGQPGFKIALHKPGEVTTPDTIVTLVPPVRITFHLVTPLNRIRARSIVRDCERVPL